MDENTRRIGLRAARYAKTAFPGAIGELIGREIGAYLDAGEQVPRYALSHRLVVAMQNMEAGHPLPDVRYPATRYAQEPFNA